MALLEGRNLRKTYRLSRRNVVPALRGVDISIEQGEMVAIMGPSGSGKSTLMHILGLLHAPDLNEGPRPDLSFGGRDMVDVGEGERTKIRANRMGFVFQDFNLVPTLTAIENVMLACDYAGVKGSEAKSRSREALALVGSGRAGRSSAGRALGRRAATGRDRARAGQQTDADPRRRADGEPRLRAGRGDPRAVPRVQPA